MRDDNAMLQAALSYAAQGFKVFPLKPSEKIPITTHGVKDATQLQATVKGYWRKYPNASTEKTLQKRLTRLTQLILVSCRTARLVGVMSGHIHRTAICYVRVASP